ncbi:MAG: OmpA family protein, partial [Myxococcota bacterium]
PEALHKQIGDKIEKREVTSEQAKIVKLKNVVPAIHFDSGVANIPPSTIAKLRSVLDSMKDLPNVRLHLVGHADNEPLSPALSGVFGDNQGLSRERAGEVAEFIQTALALPPEAISFDWAGDTQPIASNATETGRAQNRRVEVEVWYDQMEAKTGLEDVVVHEEIKRVKICRTETVCKLTYQEGHAKRARVKNLIPPLRAGEESVQVPQEFIAQIQQALNDLSDKQHVTVRFIGFTDDAPLAGRAERIYGTHLALSKALSHRVALAVKDALKLPTAVIASDGRGAAKPIASNQTDRGRALNRRVEVELWYDDPLADLPDEPQICPDGAGAETVTKVYDPPWGPIEPLQLDGRGEAQVPAGYADTLRRALGDVVDKTRPRLRLIGYTRNERLDRRTAMVYGDDVGLSAARARRVMEKLAAEPVLAGAQAEHEGRGYVQSDDVVNAGFVQGESSYVVVQVVYDELAALDDYEGVQV